MTSKITKAIASRIPADLYDEVKKEADDLELNLNDYFLKIIKARHERSEKKEKHLKQEKVKPTVEINEAEEIIKVKVPRKKKPEIKGGTQEIIFPD